MPKVFQNVGSIAVWAGHNDVRFVDGDNNMPYVQVQGVYYYFVRPNNRVPYTYVMSSLRDLVCQ